MDGEFQNSGRKWGLFLLVVAVLFVAFLFIKKNNVVRWIQAESTLKQQEKTIRTYKEEISRMDTLLENLNSNKDTLEKFAREKFNFAEPGEDVFLDNISSPR